MSGRRLEDRCRLSDNEGGKKIITIVSLSQLVYSYRKVDKPEFLEILDESISASAEQEAEKLYPYDDTLDNTNAQRVDQELTDMQRSAHINAARMYTDTIERLKAENQGLKAEIDNLKYHLDAMREQEKDMRQEFKKYQP